jgi:tetratricopeptide (TPR) repeat protein
MLLIMSSELRSKALDAIQSARRFYEMFDASLSDDQRNAQGSFTPYTNWSAKDVLGHVSFWDAEMLNRFETVGRGDKYEFNQTDDEANSGAYEARKDWSWDQVWQASRTTLDQLETYITNASDEVLEKISERRPVWMQIENSALAHGGAHFSDYELAQNNLERAEALHDHVIASYDASRGTAGRGTAVYNKACLYAKNGMKEKAMPLLTEALTSVPDLREWAKQDTDMESLHTDPDFLALVAQPA